MASRNGVSVPKNALEVPELGWGHVPAVDSSLAKENREDHLGGVMLLRGEVNLGGDDSTRFAVILTTILSRGNQICVQNLVGRFRPN